MIYRDSQLRIFKNVQKREWLKQNRLREPFIRQWRQRLKKYFNDLGNDLKEDFAYGSNTLVDLRINNSANILRNIMRVQYVIVANAFKNYFLDRTQNVKDFDTEFETRLDTYVETNVGELVTNINETTRNRIKKLIVTGKQ